MYVLGWWMIELWFVQRQEIYQTLQRNFEVLYPLCSIHSFSFRIKFVTYYFVYFIQVYNAVFYLIISKIVNE